MGFIVPLILSRVSVTIDGVWIYIRISCTLIIRNYNAVVISHTLHFATDCTVFSVCCVCVQQSLPDNGFQRCMLLKFRIHSFMFLLAITYITAAPELK
jgi:hypothetical protein